MNATAQLLIKKYYPEVVKQQEEAEAKRKSELLAFVEGMVEALQHETNTKESKVLFKSNDGPWAEGGRK
ncbi:hypothetical protein [Stutzerimonas nitrititolerans]|uniref:hypothetical protein n=1 Tax=Stutzerimonas nitrititolerans TaxID=2482751 RepID=UPI0028B1880E|nr:hypothetical protein [Stutzerimonas nitrititolerans]